LEFERCQNPQQSHSKGEPDPQLQDRKTRVEGFSVKETFGQGGAAVSEHAEDDFFVSADGKYSIGPKSHPVMSIQLDDKRVEIKDQIQMYAPNHLLTHPLVSPALQPTLGGLPPLLVLTGGGELLRDEQIYLAHKAAQPLAYLPPPSNHQSEKEIEARASRYRPTNVQLQVWDDLCHVAPTLSFTRPAKHMYRSIAQFGAWALARAQKTSIDILDDDSISFVSTDSSDSSSSTQTNSNPSAADIKLAMPQSVQHVGFESVATKADKECKVGRAGDPLPAFENHMIRQRVDRHGTIHPLAPPTELVALNMSKIEIGVPKPGPVNKWMAAQKQWNGKFAKQKIKVQKKRLREMEKGYERFEGETPPPTALAGRRVKGMKVGKPKKQSWGMSLWSLWGSKHDEATVSLSIQSCCNDAQTNTRQLVREEKADQAQDGNAVSARSGPTDGSAETKPTTQPSEPSLQPRRRSVLPSAKAFRSRSRSQHASVTDEGQTGVSLDELDRLALPLPGLAEATKIAPEREASALPTPATEFNSLSAMATPTIAVEDMSRPQSPETLIPATDTLSTRPTRGGIAYPFSLKVAGGDREVNASTATLQSLSVQDGEEVAEVVEVREAVTPTTETKLKESAQDTSATDNIERLADETSSNNGIEQSAETSSTDGVAERPVPERFITADADDILQTSSSSQTREDNEGLARPGVERFETAHSTLVNSGT
jgi:hypothetical protein